MNQTTPQLRSLAQSLIAQETTRKSSGVAALAAFDGIEKLRPHLANLMGKGGFRALLARALALAGEEVPWLNEVRINADGVVEGLEVLYTHTVPAVFQDGKVVVLARLLGLLVALIGPDLTATLVADTWPKSRATVSLSADSEVPSEKAK